MAYVEKDPVIREAQILTEKYEPVLGCDGAMILFWKGGVCLGGVSYGDTKALCRQLGKRLDAIIDAQPKPTGA